VANRKFHDATAFRASLEERLKNIAWKKGMDLQRLRREVAFDRLLARLFSGKAVPWYLKGGYAMELRIHRARTTRDVDLGRSLGPGEKTDRPALLEEIQSLAVLDLGDFFEFRIGASILELEAAYGGSRFPVEARMDGRSFVKFHIDVGLGDSLADTLEELKAKDWLGFAGIAAPVFPAISREQQFAEKVHAFTKPRKGRENTRVRDLVDMVLLMDDLRLDKKKVQKALDKTFRNRKSHPLPAKLQVPPASWDRPFAEMAAECGLKLTVPEAFGKLEKYFEGLQKRVGYGV
jgi:hypothetical protein